MQVQESNLKAHFPLSATRSYQAAQTGFPEPVREQPKNSREILFVNHTTETVLLSGDFVCFVLLRLSHPVDEAGSRPPLMLHSQEVHVKHPSRVCTRRLSTEGERRCTSPPMSNAAPATPHLSITLHLCVGCRGGSGWRSTGNSSGHETNKVAPSCLLQSGNIGRICSLFTHQYQPEKCVAAVWFGNTTGCLFSAAKQDF